MIDDCLHEPAEFTNGSWIPLYHRLQKILGLTNVLTTPPNHPEVRVEEDKVVTQQQAKGNDLRPQNIATGVAMEEEMVEVAAEIATGTGGAILPIVGHFQTHDTVTAIMNESVTVVDFEETNLQAVGLIMFPKEKIAIALLLHHLILRATKEMNQLAMQRGHGLLANRS